MAHNPALGYDEYLLCACPDCSKPVMVRGTERREVNGQRHACSDMGQPLLRSGLAGLQPMGSRERGTLRK